MIKVVVDFSSHLLFLIILIDFPVSVVYQQHGARQSTAESPILPSSGRVAPYFLKREKRKVSRNEAPIHKAIREGFCL